MSKTFYHDAKSCVSNNGNMSKFFPIRRCVRQGCPLSTTCLLYVLNYFRINFQPQKTLKVFSIQIWNLKKSLFADDASLILDGSFKSFQTLINILDNFSYISGLKVHAKKCQVLRLGSITKSNVVYLKDRKGALTWYGKLTGGSAHAWNLIILHYLIVCGMTFIFMVHLSFYAIPLLIYDFMNDITIIP